jgi:hypothetical protein
MKPLPRGETWLLAAAAALLAWVAWAQRANPLSPGQWGAVAGGLLLVVGIGLLQLHRPALQYLVLCRFPLLMAVLLVVFPFLAVTAARSMLGNLFALAPFGFGVVTFFVLFLAWVTLISLLLLAQLAPARFGVERFEPPPWMRALLDSRWSAGLAVLLAAPTLGVAWACSTISAGGKLLAAVGGTAAAGGLISLILVVRRRLVPEPDAPESPLMHEDRSPRHAPGSRVQRALERVAGALCRWLSDSFWRGYIYADGQGRKRFYRGHLFNAVSLLATFCVYLAFFLAQTPGEDDFDAFPALGYSMMLLILGTWVLSGVSFFLDRYRFPTLLLLTAASFFSFFISDTDHYYATVAADRAGEQELRPVAVFDTWYRKRVRETGEPPVLVAVTAVGGGITTALWTDRVLAGLEQEVGEGFIPSIGLVSGVSGGSVGTLYFLDALAEPDGTPLRDRLERAVASAASPSLPEAVWGLVYPDFWRILPGPWFRWKAVDDRGEALERAWERHLRWPQARLSDWRAAIRAGRLPVPVFNATITETGGRLLITPIDLGRLAAGDCRERPSRCLTEWRAHSFFELYPELDVRVATAARLSAAFPYVSPIARPHLAPGDHRGYHLADGGYYDNYGVASLVDWLDAVLPAFRMRGGRRVLVVQIRDAPAEDPGGAQRGGWVISSLGPLKTLMSIRSATQSARNAKEVGLLQRLACRDGVQVEPFVFSLAPERPDEEGLPLSWQLTDGERARVEGRWDTRANRIERCRLRTCFVAQDDGVCAAAGASCVDVVDGKEPAELPPAGSVHPCGGS